MPHIFRLKYRRAQWGRHSGIIWCSTSTASRTAQAPSSIPEYHIRRALLSDIQKISNCNRRNLPENYGNAYIANHILTWPNLSYVVEAEGNIAGYVMGKIEVSGGGTLLQRICGLHPSNIGSVGGTPLDEPVVSGHITSIAVEKSFRRSGIATELMNLIHNEMCSYPSLQSINLLCRVSNVAAIKHYSQVHGYICKRKLATYYSDGEDGWFMERRRDWALEQYGCQMVYEVPLPKVLQHINIHHVLTLKTYKHITHNPHIWYIMIACHPTL